MNKLKNTELNNCPGSQLSPVAEQGYKSNFDELNKQSLCCHRSLCPNYGENNKEIHETKFYLFSPQYVGVSPEIYLSLKTLKEECLVG